MARTDALAGQLGPALAAWLPTRRWFAKNRTVARVEIRQVVPLADGPRDGPIGLIALALVMFTDGRAPECYQVPLGARRRLPPELEPATVASAGDLVIYDALLDPELVIAMMTLPASGDPSGHTPAQFPGLLAHAQPTRVIGGEQSNTSIVIGERYVLKVFRRIEAGVNPEAELHTVLSRAGSPHIAPFLGAVDVQLDGAPVTLASVHGFMDQATDGWAVAQAHLQSLRAVSRADPDAEDFAVDAHRLGAVLADVHSDLARELGTARSDPASSRRLVAALLAKLDTALIAVPELGRHETALRAAFGQADRLPPGPPVQRIHGDLHLGQALRADGDWLLIDFEGEPAVPLAERRVPQSPLRDIAGMLRSIDYAADVHLRRQGGPHGRDDARMARGWSTRSREAFCAGYASAAGQDPRAYRPLLRVFLLEKAVYEASYEARFRPGWRDVPLRAIGRILAGH